MSAYTETYLKSSTTSKARLQEICAEFQMPIKESDTKATLIKLILEFQELNEIQYSSETEAASASNQSEVSATIELDFPIVNEAEAVEVATVETEAVETEPEKISETETEAVETEQPKLYDRAALKRLRHSLLIEACENLLTRAGASLVDCEIEAAKVLQEYLETTVTAATLKSNKQVKNNVIELYLSIQSALSAAPVVTVKPEAVEAEPAEVATVEPGPEKNSDSVLEIFTTADDSFDGCEMISARESIGLRTSNGEDWYRVEVADNHSHNDMIWQMQQYQDAGHAALTREQWLQLTSETELKEDNILDLPAKFVAAPPEPKPAKPEKNSNIAATLQKRAEKKASAPKKQSTPRVKRTEWEPIGDIKPVAQGSKVHALLCSLLEGQYNIDQINERHPRGKTQATFIAYDVPRLGYGVKIDDQQRYQLILPEGCSAIATK